jgi:monothiol glutaredoxin
MRKYSLDYEDINVMNNPVNYQEMVHKSGQSMSPCVEIDGVMLADVSGEEVENYLLSNRLVQANDTIPDGPISTGCTSGKTSSMAAQTVRFF